MVFTKRLREGVRRGEITCSVRVWMRPHVKVGARYSMDEGEIEVDSITPIGFPDITPALARESGFLLIRPVSRKAVFGADVPVRWIPGGCLLRLMDSCEPILRMPFRTACLQVSFQ